MPFEINWSVSATTSLTDSLEYIKNESPTSASRIKVEIDEVVTQLSRFPMIGPVYERDEFSRIREVTNYPFRIFYRVYSARSQVVVLLIWHVSRDEPNLDLLRRAR